MSKKELDAIDYEELRRQNIADNQMVLKQLMADIQKIMPTKVNAPARKPKAYKKRVSDPSEIRRNPSRSARFNPLHFSPPRTRSRRGSVSSTVSSSSGSSGMASPDKMVVKFGFYGRQADRADSESNDGFDDDDYVAERKRVIALRDERSADEITEDDLNLVAEFVSVKRYDSIYGSSCHQCRQKTNDMKTICRSGRCFGVRGQFCGPCLRNRYGEDAKVALKDPNWECPPCRNICNCSFCRKKQGKSCTGILIHLARDNGFSNVNEYLQSLKRKAV